MMTTETPKSSSYMGGDLALTALKLHHNSSWIILYFLYVSMVCVGLTDQVAFT